MSDRVKQAFEERLNVYRQKRDQAARRATQHYSYTMEDVFQIVCEAIEILARDAGVDVVLIEDGVESV